MGLYVIGRSVKGESHVSQNKICQDAFYYEWCEKDKALVASVADGHGSNLCLYSDEGSEIATKVFCQNMSALYDEYNRIGKLNELGAYLHKEGSENLARKLVRDWQEKIKVRHTEREREKPLKDDKTEDEHELFHLYGTTMLGMLITPEFHFAFQLGDGDITAIVHDETNTVLESDALLGVETHSLCEDKPWEFAHTMVLYPGENEFAYILTSDGFKNSHASTKDYLISCRDYIKTIKYYGLKAVEDNLEDWLQETSKEGCGDDITAAIITSFDQIEGYMDESITIDSEKPEDTNSDVNQINETVVQVDAEKSNEETENENTVQDSVKIISAETDGEDNTKNRYIEANNQSTDESITEKKDVQISDLGKDPENEGIDADDSLTKQGSLEKEELTTTPEIEISEHNSDEGVQEKPKQEERKSIEETEE